MTAKILHRGPWQIAYKATDVLCSDGVRRTVNLSSEADTFFSIPGSVQVKGKTVSGFIHCYNRSDGEGDFEFVANRNAKNYDVLPNK